MEMKRKRLIHIGGTSRSGSTLLARILANNEFSCNLGEIESVFLPTRRHHYDLLQEIRNEGNEWAYLVRDSFLKYPFNVFRNKPAINFIDSSKSVFWINRMNLKSRALGYKCANVLIFKSPEEFAYSILKRGNKNWVKQYIGYHRKYFSTINQSYFIYYKDMIEDDATLKRLYSWLGMDFNSEYLKYWDSEEIGFFGSSTPAKNAELKYNSFIPAEILAKIEEDIRRNPEVLDIWSYLFSKRNSAQVIETYRGYSWFRMSLHKANYSFKKFYRRLYPENYTIKLL